MYDSRATGFTKFGSDETRTIEVAGNLGIPSADSGTIAVTLTLTSTGGEGGSTRATAWTEGNAAPGTTSLSLGAGTLRSNTITVGLDAAGAFKLRNTGSPANYIIDMQGWYEVVSPETVTCDEDLTDRELPVSNPGSASECSTVLDGYTPVDTYVGDDGEAFWVSDEEQSPSPANPVVIQMEDSSARVQSQDPPSDQELKTLIDGGA